MLLLVHAHMHGIDHRPSRSRETACPVKKNHTFLQNRTDVRIIIDLVTVK